MTPGLHLAIWELFSLWLRLAPGYWVGSWMAMAWGCCQEHFLECFQRSFYRMRYCYGLGDQLLRATYVLTNWASDSDFGSWSITVYKPVDHCQQSKQNEGEQQPPCCLVCLGFWERVGEVLPPHPILSLWWLRASEGNPDSWGHFLMVL